MNCKDKGYEVGQVFKVINGCGEFEEDSIIVLSYDDGSDMPKFDLVEGWCESKEGIKTEYGAYTYLSNVKRIYPPESEKVHITIDGKTAEISRESAAALKEMLNGMEL